MDQSTEQKGRAGEGALISSNPRDNYRIIGTHSVPTERFKIIFPYSVERDREAWRWSWGYYGEIPGTGPPTASEMRKLTGKAAEIAAILTRLPLSTDFFKEIESDLVATGQLSEERRAWVCGVLKQVPLLARQSALREQLQQNRDWYVRELMDANLVSRDAAEKTADGTFSSLLAGWTDPVLRRTAPNGEIIEEVGVPLRALLAYLFGEVTKNFHLVHHPDSWISCVTASQRGDCCFSIDPARLPARDAMEGELAWEKSCSGPERMERWLDHVGASPFDYNRDLDDHTLSQEDGPEIPQIRGGNFFRGLALIDLAEAMLKRAFGTDAVAVRVNAAGQGDYFQVHVNIQKAAPEDVMQFIESAFYRRFGLEPSPRFVKVHSGGGAFGTQLSRYDTLPQVIHRLRAIV